MNAPSIDEPGTRLLTLLDALVRKDGASPGFAGEICVGVRVASGTVWWKATFGDGASTGFSKERPAAGTTMLLGEVEAESILMEGVLPKAAKLCQIEGDRSMIAVFLDRYAAKAGSIDVRAKRGRR